MQESKRAASWHQVEMVTCALGEWHYGAMVEAGLNYLGSEFSIAFWEISCTLYFCFHVLLRSGLDRGVFR